MAGLLSQQGQPAEAAPEQAPDMAQEQPTGENPYLKLAIQHLSDPQFYEQAEEQIANGEPGSARALFALMSGIAEKGESEGFPKDLDAILEAAVEIADVFASIGLAGGSIAPENEEEAGTDILALAVAQWVETYPQDKEHLAPLMEGADPAEVEAMMGGMQAKYGQQPAPQGQPQPQPAQPPQGAPAQ